MCPIVKNRSAAVRSFSYGVQTWKQVNAMFHSGKDVIPYIYLSLCTWPYLLREHRSRTICLLRPIAPTHLFISLFTSLHSYTFYFTVFFPFHADLFCVNCQSLWMMLPFTHFLAKFFKELSLTYILPRSHLSSHDTIWRTAIHAYIHLHSLFFTHLKFLVSTFAWLQITHMSRRHVYFYGKRQLLKDWLLAQISCELIDCIWFSTLLLSSCSLGLQCLTIWTIIYSLLPLVAEGNWSYSFEICIFSKEYKNKFQNKLRIA